MLGIENQRTIGTFYVAQAIVRGKLKEITSTALRARNSFLSQLLTDAELRECLKLLEEKGSLIRSVGAERYTTADPMGSRSKVDLDAATEAFRGFVVRYTREIARQISMEYLIARQDPNPEADPGWREFRDQTSIGSKRFSNLMRLAQPWHDLRARRTRESAERFIEKFAELFHLKHQDSLVEDGLALPVGLLQVPILGMEKPFSLLLYLAGDEAQLQQCLAHMAKAPPGNQRAILYFPPQTSVLDRCHDVFGRKLIRLTEDRLKPLAAAPDPHEALVNELLKQADLSLLSPYKSQGAVPGHMFYGREVEVARLAAHHDTSFAIYGPRRIGKTSLALKLYSILEKEPSEHEKPVYIDCTLLRSRDDVLDELAQRLRLAWKPGDSDRAFVSVIRGSSTKRPEGSRLVLILDEIDPVIRSDKEHADLFWTLRVLINEKTARVVVCGYQDLRQVSRSLNHPTYNMFQFLHLKNLDNASAEALVRIPLRGLGVSFDPNEDTITRAIVNRAGTHPGTIQFFCDQVLAVLNQKGENVITSQDLETVDASPEFVGYVLDGLSDLSVRDRKLIRSHDVVSQTPMASIFENCKEVLSKEEVQQAVQNLVDLMIMNEVEGPSGPEYVYAQPTIPKILRQKRGTI